MLKNYIKIAWRNLRKNKIDSFISIGGLSIGLACCILLVAYVHFEWSRDNFHKNADRIFRVAQESKNPNSGEVNKSLITPYPLSVAIDSTYPGVKQVIDLGGTGIHYEKNNKFIQQRALLAGPGFFEAFTFPLLYGDAQTALSQPGNIVLTEGMAERIFNNKQVVGETINIRLGKETYTYTVSGVAKSIPANSSIQFEMVLPYESRFREMDAKQAKTYRESWYIGAGETWVVLNEKVSPEELETQFPALLKTNIGSFAERMSMRLWLQPFEEAYFNQEYQSGITGNSNVLYSLILGGIAVVILAIAGINFMSLTLSRAVTRSHEIGIRKSVGALRNQLSFQIIGEVFLTCAISLLAGLVLAELASPLVEQIVDKPVQLGVITQPALWVALAAILVLLTLVTGLYPAFKMSRKKATQLFSSQRTAERIPTFVKGLICVQFALTISFLICTFVMQNQLQYLFNKDLGFSSSNVIAIEVNLEGEEAQKAAELFQQEAERITGVQQVALTSSGYRSYPGSFGSFGFGMATMKSATTLEGFGGGITSESVGEHYLETMGVELLEGHNFSLDRPSELKDGIIVNQRFVETMGWDNPIGQIIKDDGETWQAPFDGKKVIGVIEDYNYRPLYSEVQPMALNHISVKDYDVPQTILVKNASTKISETLQKLSGLWDEVVPAEAFKYAFMDDMVARQYQEEQRWSRIMKLASAMAIILACFGLFGLAALAAQRRTKEIGIRKVLGATITNIVGLLSKDFVTLVIIGFVMAVPLAWYAMNQWLEDFAYKIEIGPGIFLLAGGLSLLIALATISWQSIRAALANPVDSLRSE